MQYERLIERSRLPPERMFTEHMRMVADMDFLVTSVRRLLRTAEFARQIPSDHQQQLRQAISVFKSRWWVSLKGIRDALEHSDTAKMFPVPAVGIPMSGHGDDEFTFMWPGGNIDLGKLYEDARSMLKAILRIIEPVEAERDAEQAQLGTVPSVCTVARSRRCHRAVFWTTATRGQEGPAP
jgi:hypothetical protein